MFKLIYVNMSTQFWFSCFHFIESPELEIKACVKLVLNAFSTIENEVFQLIVLNGVDPWNMNALMRCKSHSGCVDLDSCHNKTGEY